MTSLRAIVFQLYFYGLTIAACLFAGVPVLLFAPHRSLDLARAWVAAVLAGARIICGMRVEVTGRQHLPLHGPALIACQHQSAIDTLLWFTILDAPSYVMKRELTRIPVFGALLVNAGMIPVDRGAGAGALRHLLGQTARKSSEGRQIVIFPQGTRVAPGETVPLQPGVAAVSRQTGLPVVPVSLDSGRLWGRGFLHRRPGVIHVAIQPPIPAGTPRPAMLAAIGSSWCAAAAIVPDKTAQRTVDNSVDANAAKLMFTGK